MPKFTEHCQRSIDLFGEDGEEYHRWIDQYSQFGYSHRTVLHNKEGVEIGVQLFGEAARRHLEQHIKDDRQLEKIPTIKQLRIEQGKSYVKGLKRKHAEDVSKWQQHSK